MVRAFVPVKVYINIFQKNYSKNNLPELSAVASRFTVLLRTEEGPLVGDISPVKVYIKYLAGEQKNLTVG